MTTKNGLPTMTTYSGILFDFSDPTPDMIRIEDIAHALSLECRFQNQCHPLYSVAQHSILVSDYAVPKDPFWIKDEKRFRLTALLHDAAEAYCGDMNKPLKMLLPEYTHIEMRIYAVIAVKFELPAVIPDEIKEIDQRILANEGRLFMHDGWNGAKYEWDPKIRVGRAWPPAEAEKEFLWRFRDLVKP
jgi:hypothetical protein